MGLSAPSQSVKNDAQREAVGFLRELFYLINSNPAGAVKTLKDIVAMTDKEEARAKEGREYIAKYESLLSEMGEKQRKADETLSLAEKRNKDAESRELANVAEASRLAAVKVALEKISKTHIEKDTEHKKKDTEHAQKEAVLTAWENRLKTHETSLSEKHAAVDAHANALRKKAEGLRAAAESF